jgi:gamma-D-glutamyl-L-lysine dipeptidyl-peptidase
MTNALNTAEYRVCIVGVVPLMEEPRHGAEKGSELLFGQTFSVIDSVRVDGWVHIQCSLDGYKGWIREAGTLKIDRVEFDKLNAVTQLVKNICRIVNDSGEFIWIFPGTPCCTQIAGVNYNFDAAQVMEQHREGSTEERINTMFDVAQLLYGSPYGWGGGTPAGIDCSRLTQILYSFLGIQLPRNSSQQALRGIEVLFSQVRRGDLAFFGGNSKVSHVGIVCEDSGEIKLLHSSQGLGVHVDGLTADGIVGKDGAVTHQPIGFRRIIP